MSPPAGRCQQTAGSIGLEKRRAPWGKWRSVDGPVRRSAPVKDSLTVEKGRARWRYAVMWMRPPRPSPSAVGVAVAGASLSVAGTRTEPESAAAAGVALAAALVRTRLG